MEKRVLGVLGGRDLPGPMFKLWAQSADILVAADSGADFLIDEGFRPDAIVGDMDSISVTSLELGIDLYRVDDQSRTDCDKLLGWVHERGHAGVTLIGLEGDRLDHLVGTLHSALHTPLDVRLAVRDGVGRVLDPGAYRLPAVPGRRVSLLPLRPSTGVHLTGVQWPLASARLELGGAISLSNVALEDEVLLEFEDGAILVLQEVPQEDLPIWGS